MLLPFIHLAGTPGGLFAIAGTLPVVGGILDLAGVRGAFGLCSRYAIGYGLLAVCSYGLTHPTLFLPAR